jgi:hypothetical protein
VSHVTPQTPPEQLALPLGGTPHAALHAPQWAGSAAVSTQVALHSTVPPEQVDTQLPFWHTSPALHAMPQPPQ